METYEQLAHSVTFLRVDSRFILTNKHESLELIGEGRSAAVFKIKNSTKAMKVFFPPFMKIAKEEAENYKLLQGIAYFPTLYEVGDNYLVMDYITGDTFFDCLSKGLTITSEHIKHVDKALSLAKKCGLNPSDIHLRNLILTEKGDIKVIDVARFSQKKQCRQWSDLRKAFYKLYTKRFCPKKVPVWLLNSIAALYKKRFA